jgi:hypothetical protein
VEGSTRLLHELGDDYAEVLAEHRRALRETFVRHEGRELVALIGLSNVAFAMFQLGEREGAVSRIRECLDLAEQLGFTEAICWSLEATAATQAERRPETAARLMGAATALLESLNGSYGPSERRLRERTVATVTASLGERTAKRLETEGREMKVESAVELARQLLD